MDKWDLLKKAGQIVALGIALVVPYFLLLAIIGSGIAAAAYHLGEAIGGHGPLPAWLDPARVVAAVSSAFGAMSGAIIALVTIEYQRIRQKMDIRKAVRESLDEAANLVAEFRSLKAANNADALVKREEIGGALIAAMTVAENASGTDEKMAKLFGKMRPRSKMFAVLTGDAPPMDVVHREYESVMRVARHLPDWRAILD